VLAGAAAAAAGHQKKLMLAVDKLSRLSAALLRHSALRHHRRDDVTDTLRHSTPPAVVPIGLCHSATLLPAAATSSTAPPLDDDAVTPTNVTSFLDGDERRNTSSSRDYFGAADAYTTVNVNGVCFSVYGTLPRNLVRRRARQGQDLGQGHGQGQVESQKFPDTPSDRVRTLRSHAAPSPPERTNSVKSDLRRSTENVIDSTLTRRRRVLTSGECRENETVARYNGTAPQATTSRTPKVDEGCYSVSGSERSASSAGEETSAVNHRMTRQTASPVEAAATVMQRPPNVGGESSDKVTVLGQQFDSGTVKRRHESAAVAGGEITRGVALRADRQVDVDDDAVSSRKDVAAVDVPDHEFDSGTVKRRHKPVAEDDRRQSTDSATADVKRR